MKLEPSLARLTRWLALATAAALAPHLPALPPWVAAAGLAPVLLTLATPWRPPRAAMAFLAVGGAAGVVLAHNSLFGREAGLSLFALMVGFKLLETRNLRDVRLSLSLDAFLLALAFLHGQSPGRALYALGALGTIVFVLALASQSEPKPRAAVRESLRLLLAATPIMLTFFVLFPRPATPLWGVPGEAQARSGISGEMSPGSISRLALSGAVAFRAEFSGPLPPPERRYWRGPVLEVFDGRTWRRRPVPTPPPALAAHGPELGYVLTLEPQEHAWVFALEMPDPQRLPPATRLSSQFELSSLSKVNQRRRFTLFARDEYTLAARDDATLAANLALPADGNPRARALGKRLRADGADDRTVVDRALALFRNEGFHYTLMPPLLGADAVDEFLFDTRRGFCEHYAGAFTFLMRAAGVPARVVTGYQGGEYNRFGHYLVVRQSDAHAWSEVWLEGRGWVRVDPTAAVAAERIEAGLAAALPQGEPLPFWLDPRHALATPLRQALDLFQDRWNRWVLGFDQEKQIGLFYGLGLGFVSARKLALFLVASLALLLALYAVAAVRPRCARKDEASRLFAAFSRRLARRGVVRAPAEGPLAFGERAAERLPEHAAAIRHFLALYLALRYGPPGKAPPASEVKRALRAL